MLDMIGSIHHVVPTKEKLFSGTALLNRMGWVVGKSLRNNGYKVPVCFGKFTDWTYLLLLLGLRGERPNSNQRGGEGPESFIMAWFSPGAVAEVAGGTALFCLSSHGVAWILHEKCELSLSPRKSYMSKDVTAWLKGAHVFAPRGADISIISVQKENRLTQSARYPNLRARSRKSRDIRIDGRRCDSTRL